MRGKNLNAVMREERLRGSEISIRVLRQKAARESTIVPFEQPESEVQTTMEGSGALCLEQWVRATRFDEGARAFPKGWITGKAGEGGIAAGSPRPPTILEEDIAKTDKAVAQLAMRYKSKLREVIRVVFELALPERDAAKIMHCNRSELRSLTKRACRAIYSLRAAL